MDHRDICRRVRGGNFGKTVRCRVSDRFGFRSGGDGEYFCRQNSPIRAFHRPRGSNRFFYDFFHHRFNFGKMGKKEAQTAVWAGFFSSLVLAISVYIVINWQPAVFAAEFSEMFAKVFALTPRITLAGFIAYLISQHHDVWAFHFWKKKTNEKHLWLRNNASTITSQFIDSVIFIFIAFYGIFPIYGVNYRAMGRKNHNRLN